MVYLPFHKQQSNMMTTNLSKVITTKAIQSKRNRKNRSKMKLKKLNCNRNQIYKVSRPKYKIYLKEFRV